MARRRSKRKRPPKKKVIVPLDKTFNCPFCHHVKSCSVEFNDDRDAAEVTCEVCDEHFQMPINYLHEAIDVYNEWIDQCDAANVKYIND